MTLERCKKCLADLLADSESRVIALSGKWGTGKSHLWSEVQKLSQDANVRSAVYVSLFGLKSISELRLKVAHGALLNGGPGGVVAAKVGAALSKARELLRSLNSRFSAVDELALLVAPVAIQGRFIVIDDVERKHESLHIEEILGFIDECVQRQGCRILLILNSDHLADQGNWNTLREKVVDQELQLDTSPQEAFSIASSLTATPYVEHIGAAIEKCKVTNIRIIRKVIRVVNHLLGVDRKLPQEVLSRTIPSTTLLSAIHYKGIEGGPDFEFVLDFNKFMIASVLRRDEEGTESETPEYKERERWHLLLDGLGIQGTDEYESVVISYLKSGLMDSGKVEAVLAEYLAEGRRLAARARFQSFDEHCVWHPSMSDAELLQEAEELLPDVEFLAMFPVTDLYQQVTKLDGGADLANRLIDAWLTAFRQRHPPGQEPDFDSDYNHPKKDLHPKIAAELEVMRRRRTAALSALDVCRKYMDQGGWGTREENCMRSITAAEYEAEIRCASGQDLKILLLQSVYFLKNRKSYERHFGGACQSFLIACRAIVRSDPGSKLSLLIHGLLADDEELRLALTASSDEAAVMEKGA